MQIGDDLAAALIRDRAGGAFDPDVARPFADHAAEILAFDPHGSAWPETLASEPQPHLMLQGNAIDQALGAIGDLPIWCRRNSLVTRTVSPGLPQLPAGGARSAPRRSWHCGAAR
jgi:hypothetical protein